MARGGSSNPTIRILMCGAPGVGKACLESRFATGYWPPSYDSSLTLCSRRSYTFQYGPSAHPSRNDNKNTFSQTSSNPGSLNDPQTPFSTASTQVASPSESGSTSIEEDDPSGPCRACLEKSQTYLIEIINYPRLSSPRHRQQVLSQGAYDAVLLVYSVGDRASFDLIKKFHSEIPLREQPKRRKTASWKSSGLLGIFTPTPANGKQTMVNGDVAACEGMGSGRAVVAIAGNKCDLDGEAAPDMEQPEKSQVEDVDHGTALFRLPLPRVDDDRSLSTTSGSSNSHQHRPTSNLSTRSSEALNEWMQMGMTNEPEIAPSADRDVIVACRNLSGSRTTVKSRRQVSHVDGEGLALELDTQVPFFETSAKTGENVEELLEATARAVLKNMGRGEVSRGGLSKKCQHRDLTVRTEPQETVAIVGAVAPRLDVPLFACAPASVSDCQSGKNGSSVQHAEVGDMGEKQAVGGAQRAYVQCQQIARRPSILGRMRIFWKKESTLAEGLTV